MSNINNKMVGRDMPEPIRSGTSRKTNNGNDGRTENPTAFSVGSVKDEQIEKALNACMFGQTKADRCKDCPLDSDKEPCITNLHLAALEYIGRLKKRAEVAERALLTVCTNIVTDEEDDLAVEPRARVLYKAYLKQAEKELAEGAK